MKTIALLFTLFLVLSSNAQDSKALPNPADAVVKAQDQSSFIEKFAGDQVRRLTKKLKLSETQQNQVSALVISQLKSEKVQQLISNFSPEALMGKKAQEEIAKTVMGSSTYQKEMSKILTPEQKKMSSKL